MKNYINFTDEQLRKYKVLYSDYRKMYESPNNCLPKFIIDTPLEYSVPVWEERLADPLLMLKSELDNIKAHLEVGDDKVPTVRVNFGTAQVAAAFGCEMYIPTNNLPCASTHVLEKAEDIFNVELPELEAGWYGKLKLWTEIFKENLPFGVHIQHPDIQSAFNTSHLIRGNDILTDFFDDPDALEALLDKVTDYMIKIVPWLKGMISEDNEYFFDWGALWRGCARISNCSMHMISPQMYIDYIFPRDIRLMEAIGGGRIHYCGTHRAVIDEFFKNRNVFGLDFDGSIHDLWELAEKAPENFTLLQWGETKKTAEKLLSGNWPKKRNVIYQLGAPSVEQGRKLLEDLHNSMNRFYN